MTPPLAILGSLALVLTFVWLGSAILASMISERKGYGEKPGLATGMLLNLIGVLVWLVWPAKADSRWKLQGAFGRGSDETVAEARARLAAADEQKE